ncbi:MAG: aminotransferase class I/II-fold pyridoxal phosphate-dependent enzyme [Cytophagales bacterium]|nr:aminotransferase class I/II-fold pyridoxal phosphate-dependent enzyme [Cytophagales bacterium]
MDLFERVLSDQGPLGKHSNISEGYFMFPKLEGEIGPRMKFLGKEVLNWSLNNYLGLANHPEVRKADAEAATQYGMAYPMGARMMSGQTKYHEQLENELADFVNKESAYLLNFGYQGIISVIDALLKRQDAVVYDSECHACIIDALRMFVGKRFVFPHNDIANCEKQLERATKLTEQTGGGILVITEGVFGMAGDMGNIKQITELKKRFDFRLLIDDAHGFGTMGKTGAGAAEEQGVQDQVDLYFSTFAKSMAGIGAFIAGPKNIIRHLKYNMRSQIFAKSLPMPMVIGSLKRLELVRTKPELRKNLWTVVNALQSGLRDRGFNIGKTQSPVTPIFLNGNDYDAGHLVMDLRENYGLFCSMVIYPVVPKGVIMLRIIPTAVHTLDDVKYTIDVFEKILVKLKSGSYSSTEAPQAAALV